MALIKCPECGGEISDKADHCVHCGCQIIVCPECGQAAVADSEICTNCGMKLVRAPRTDLQEQLQAENAFQTADNFQKIWERENKARKAIARVLKYSEWVLGAIALILIVAGSFSLYSWVSKLNSPDAAIEALETLAEVKNLRERLNLMIVFAAILFALSNLSSIAADCFLPYQYAVWFTRHHIAAKDILKDRDEFDVNMIKIKDVKSFLGQETMKKGLFWAENAREATKEMVLRAISFLLIVLMCIFGAVALQENLNAYLSSVLLTGEFEFQYINLIVVAALLVVRFVYFIIYETICDKKIENWASSFTKKQS